MISTKALPSGKEFTAPDVFENVDPDDSITLGGMPLFDIEALPVEGFVDHYAVDGWLPGDIQFEWTKTWCWCHQCAF